MANLLTLDILTPTGPIAEASSVQVESVSVPAVQGEIGLLAEHIPILTPISPGIVSYSKSGVKTELAIGGGMLDVSSNGVVTILAERIHRANEVDREKTEAELAKLRHELSEQKDSIDSHEMKTMLKLQGWLEAQLRIVAT